MEGASTPAEEEIAALHADFDKYRKLATERLDAGHLKIADQLLSLIGDIAKRVGNLEGLAVGQASEVPRADPSPTPPKDFPIIWRDRAEEARVHAEQMKHRETRRQMLSVAATYERLAANTEARAAKKKKP